MYKSILIILSISFSSAASAEFIEFDWASPGDAGITYDTDTGLDWLDITFTQNISVYDLNSAMLPGGAFEGWRYAQEHDLRTLSENYGLPFQEVYYDTSPESLAAAERLVDQVMGGYHMAIYQESAWVYRLRHVLYHDGGVMFEMLPHYNDDYGTPYPYYGSFIIREGTHVPLPAATWLFLTGLFALSGVGLRKSR
jgi:hypothetical protein